MPDAPITTVVDPNQPTAQELEQAQREAKSRVSIWKKRLTAADDVHTEWATKFECQTLEDYWEGRQWKGYTDDEARAFYVVNLVFASIETKKPTLLFYKPDYKVTAKPGALQTEGSTAEARAQLCEDTLQTIVDDKRTLFRALTGLSMTDAEFRFGLIEVGYSANWIDNPNAGKPVLNDDTSEMESRGEKVVEPPQMLGSETVFIKRIPPEHFRVSKRPTPILAHQDWCGYFEWVYVDDVKRNPAYENTEDLKPTGSSRPRKGEPAQVIGKGEDHADMVKLWKIWDLRLKTKTVIAEGHDLPLLEAEPYKTFPLCDLKYIERRNSYYPIPPQFNGRLPQDEVNEIRQRQREHGKRFIRRYTVYEQSMDPEEIEKIEKGGDGVIARRKVANPNEAIAPVQDANLHPYTAEDLQLAKDDFHQVVGITAEQEGVSDADTATQANIVDMNAKVRTTSHRVTVADWLAEIGTAILGTVIDKMQLPFWVSRNVDLTALQSPAIDPQNPQAGMMAMLGAQQRAVQIAQEVKQIEASDLGDLLGIDVSVDVGALSPVSQAQEMQAWQVVFQWMSTLPTLMAMATSDAILKKMLTSVGLRSASDMAEVKKLAQQLLIMQAMAAAPGAGAGVSGPQGQPPGQPAGLPAMQALGPM